MQNTKKGFTLIELLIVITIIGILAAALLPSVLGAPAKARDAARAADLNSIVAALEAQGADGVTYPATPAGLCVSSLTSLEGYVAGGVIPSDPNTTAVNSGCTSGYTYCKLPATANQNYVLISAVENAGNGTTNGTAAQVTAICATAAGNVDLSTAAGTDPIMVIVQ